MTFGATSLGSLVNCVANDRWVHQTDNESHEKAAVCVGGWGLLVQIRVPLCHCNRATTVVTHDDPQSRSQM